MSAEPETGPVETPRLRRKPGPPKGFKRGPKVTSEPAYGPPVSVKVTFRNGVKVEFGCGSMTQESGFWKFDVPSPDPYRETIRYIALAEVADLEVTKPRYGPNVVQSSPAPLQTFSGPVAAPVLVSTSAHTPQMHVSPGIVAKRNQAPATELELLQASAATPDSPPASMMAR